MRLTEHRHLAHFDVGAYTSDFMLDHRGIGDARITDLPAGACPTYTEKRQDYCCFFEERS